jgi:hypothetical protein
MNMAKRSNSESQDRLADAVNNNPGASLDDLFQSLLPGAKRRTSDLVGAWDPDSSGPIVFIPRHAVVGDGKKFDASKPSLLIFGELVKACMVMTKEPGDTEGTPVAAKPGDMIGIWAKPGMRDLADLCGVEVVMARDVSLDKPTDKGNDMKGFRIASVKTGTRIPITIDRRDESRGVATLLDPHDYGREPEPTYPT